jgi:hypothetical protein
MIGLVGIRRFGWWVLLFVLTGVMTGCSSDGEVAAPSSDPSTTAVVDSVIDVDEFGIMDSSAITDSFYPEITEDDIEVVEGDAGTSYRYVFPTRELSDGISVDLEARWDPADDGYQASLKWGLIGDETSPSGYVFVASVPKSFAETVDDIVFDPEPTRVIDPDPILEWEIDLSGLAQRWIAASSEAGFDPGETSGLAMLTIGEILSKANAIRVNAELDACGGRLVQSAEMLGQCYLNVVAANPGAFGTRDCEVMELLSGGRGDDYPGLSGACQAILDLNKGINDPICAHEVDGDEIEACREAMWTLLSGGCLTGNALERQVCVYEAAVATSREGRCEILDHLGNPEMANDCRAAVTMNHLYCARTEDPELRASCCENFRGTDDYGTCLDAIREDAAGESTSSTTDEGTTSSDPADSTTTEPAEEEPPPAIPAGTYTGSFDEALLIDLIAFDFGKPETNMMTVTVDGGGVISGDIVVYQEGVFQGCVGAVAEWTGSIDSGQGIGPDLPQIVTSTVTTFFLDPFDAGSWNNARCLVPPVPSSEQGILSLSIDQAADGVLSGLANDYMPFELLLVP